MRSNRKTAWDGTGNTTVMRRCLLIRTLHTLSASVSWCDEEEAVDSGVAQICNLLYRRFAIGSVFPSFLRVLGGARAAEYNSAIQQITNLRYGCEISGLTPMNRSAAADEAPAAARA